MNNFISKAQIWSRLITNWKLYIYNSAKDESNLHLIEWFIISPMEKKSHQDP